MHPAGEGRLSLKTKRAPKGKGGTALPWQTTQRALAAITTGRDRYRAVMTTWDRPLDEIMQHLFEPGVLALCQEAWQVCSDYNRSGSAVYTLAPGVTTRLSWQKEGSLLPRPELANKLPVPGLIEYAEQVRHIHYEYQLVRDVFTWFNINASAGALRAYCPWIDALVSHDWGTGGYREPDGLGAIIHKTREVAEIVARACLVQQAPKAHTLNYRLYFDMFECNGVDVPSFCIDD